MEVEPKLPTIEDFTFLKPISRGAFGKVFLGCKTKKPEQLYAIKVMKKSDMINKNLTNQVVTERDAMAKVSSPFVVNLYYSIQTLQNIFLVMEYLIGGDVKSLLGIAGYFDEHMAVMYIAEVTLALEYLHSKRIIHRDLKPDNMLITAKGHIKLTDFGLSKFNMSFNTGDQLPMSPKTPMLNFLKDYDMYRTPGQILSLRSSLAFSSDVDSVYSGKRSTPRRPPSELCMSIQESINSPVTSQASNVSQSTAPAVLPVTPKLPQHKLMKQKSMHDVLLSQSASKYLSQHGMPVSTPVDADFCEKTVTRKAPVIDLMDSLQESTNHGESTESEGSERSSVNISDVSSIAHVTRPLGMSFSCRESPRGISSIAYDACSNTSNNGQSTDGSDSVFYSDACFSEEIERFRAATDSAEAERCKTCHKQKSRDRNCSECQSHLKFPSRQEKITDDTPQMHRTDESVWNSYAAKNLRSLRCGLYSEDSDGDKENTESLPAGGLANKNVENGKHISNSFNIFMQKTVCNRAESIRQKANRLRKTKSFSYPSDDEDSDGGYGRYRNRVMFAKKRGICDVEQSPVRRTHSADSGLTQEFRLLRCSNGEPLYKRSNSIPRTRIRFHSGHKLSDKTEPLLEGQCSKDMQTCLGNIVPKCRNLSNSDNMTSLSADEKRLVEGHSDTSMSEEMDRVAESILENITSPETTKDIKNKIRNCIEAGTSDVDSNKTNKQFVNKSIAALQRPVVSSVKSGDDGKALSLNLSSIHDDEEKPMDVSVLTPEDVAGKKAKIVDRSPDNKEEEFSPLLPPPPPRARKPSGKKTPGRITFASIATCVPPYVSNDSVSRHSSNTSVVQMTPEPVNRARVQFRTPETKYVTPQSPLQRPLMRSQSFSFAMKTPYRTPKSVRRAPPPTEDNRILGTPDYLAPEILQQKPHGTGVDWWSLGICFFEFLTGVPPFNDQTPELVFQNILTRDIPWPEGEEAISENCRQAIEALLTMDPDQRPGARAIRRMAAFKEIDWPNLLDMEAPWVPQPDNNTDTSYFEARNMMQDLFVSDVDF